MMHLKYLSPRFACAFIKNVCLKLRYGKQLHLNPFKVYIEQGVRISIKGGGKITFDGNGHRIYITRGSDLVASGGNLELGAGVFVNKNCTIVSHEQVIIGADTMIAPNVSIFDSDHSFVVGDLPFRSQGYKKCATYIGSNVWLGTNAVVTKGSEIGNNVVIGANSIVRGHLEADAVYVGMPVKLVRRI